MLLCVDISEESRVKCKDDTTLLINNEWAQTMGYPDNSKLPYSFVERNIPDFINPYKGYWEKQLNSTIEKFDKCSVDEENNIHRKYIDQVISDLLNSDLMHDIPEKIQHSPINYNMVKLHLVRYLKILKYNVSSEDLSHEIKHD